VLPALGLSLEAAGAAQAASSQTARNDNIVAMSGAASTQMPLSAAE
jgi:hypothetical protein